MTELSPEFIASLPYDVQAQLYMYACRKELERRVSQPFSAQTQSRWKKYEKDPAGFIEQELKEYIWSKQREICEALLAYDRVAVKSCHSSGKSFITARIAGWWIAVHPPGSAIVVTSAPTFAQVKGILWKEINRVHVKGDLPGYTNSTEWYVGRDLVALGRKPDDNNMPGMQGYHAEFPLVLLDEAGGVPISVWTAAESLVSNGGIILAIGNPDDPLTEFANVCKPGSGYHVITISAFITPNFTDEIVDESVKKMLVSRKWVEDKRKKWGETSPFYISKVLAEFPESNVDALIPLPWIREAIERGLEPDGPNELGVDVARHGGNETVIYHRRGPVARLYAAFSDRDLMVTVGRVVQAIRETGAKTVKIDDIGMGGGVTDRLNELLAEIEGPIPKDVAIIPVNVGLPPSETDPLERKFANAKAEYSFMMRDLFQEGRIDLGDDEDTLAQISVIKYTVNSRGQLVVQSKEDIHKQLAKLHSESESLSPDRWDALVLCFAEPLHDGLQDWRKLAEMI